MLATLIRVVVSRAAAVLYRLERRGPAVPDGPVILAANHPNSLIDPLVVFRTAGRHARPLAKAPLFDRPIIGRLIRGVGGIPVYRRQDDPAAMGRNEDAFRATTEALLAGSAIQIFPEGRSHSEPALSELRTGAARMALAAEADSGWSAGVRIVPVGLTYHEKRFFRGRAIALYGEPIAVAGYRDDYETDAYRAARELTDELTRRLAALTLNLSSTEDAPLVETAERLYAREKAIHGWREAAPLADRLPRLQAFAHGLAWLRAHDPERHRRLERAVERYRRRTAALGVGEGEVPDRYRLAPTLRWAARVALPALLLAPLAAAAAFFWYLPYRLVGWGVGRNRGLPEDVVATYKLAGGLMAMPLFLGLWTLAAWLWLGKTAALVTLVALPALGLAGLAAVERGRRVLEDVRLFGRVHGRAGVARRLTTERRALVTEFEAIRRIIEGSEPPAGVKPYTPV